MSERALVIGTGNALRRDDAAGLAAARLARSAGMDAIEVCGDLSSLTDRWDQRNRVIIVDAVSTGAPPGSLYRFEAAVGPLPACFALGSTHAFGVAEAVELARVLGRLPHELVVYGIEGGDFSPGEGLSPEVERAVEKTAARIVIEAGDAR